MEKRLRKFNLYLFNLGGKEVIEFVNSEIDLAQKELISSCDWRLIPMIKIFALKQHADKLCGMDAIEDIEELHKRIDALLKEKLN